MDAHAVGIVRCLLQELNRQQLANGCAATWQLCQPSRQCAELCGVVNAGCWGGQPSWWVHSPVAAALGCSDPDQNACSDPDQYACIGLLGVEDGGRGPLWWMLQPDCSWRRLLGVAWQNFS